MHGIKLTPRLPRGVSRIPHLVQASEVCYANQHYQHHQSTDEIGNNQASNDSSCSSSSRYLTFSRDQATSHFQLLRDELRGQTRNSDNETSKQKPPKRDKENEQDEEDLNIQKQAIFHLTSQEKEDFQSVADRKKVNSPLIDANETTSCPTGISSPVSAPSLRQQHHHQQHYQQQQPICEAFIMTGQSMLKLSSNESDSTNNININKKTTKTISKTSTNNQNRDQSTNHSHQDNSRAKSVSLNKLNNFHKYTDNLSSADEITTPRSVSNSTNSQTSGIDRQEQVQVQVQVEEREQQVKEASSLAAASEDKKFECLRSSKPVVERFAGVVLLQNGYQKTSINSQDDHHVHDKLDSPITIETKQVPAMISQPVKYPSLRPDDKDKRTSSPPSSPSSSKTCSSPESPPESLGQATRTDQDSAKRLAKRLYNLSGFKRSDVCHHLSKSNPFSQLVAAEYLALFDFRSMKLDAALRKFLSKLRLNGETQEREKLLSQFSQRYYDCNRDKFPSADIVQTLVCALILLNTDLHGQHHNKKNRSKLSLGAFIDGLNSSIEQQGVFESDRLAFAPMMNEIPALVGSQTGLISKQQSSPTIIGYTLPRNLLIDLYASIKKKPLKCADEKCDMSYFETELDKIYNQQVAGSRSNTLPTRRFAPGSNAPSSTLSASSRRQFKQGLNRFNHETANDSTIEFKCGYLNRKRVFEAGGIPTARGKRAWRRVHACLEDLRLILRPGIYDESKQEQQNNNNKDNKQLTAKQQAKLRAQNLALDMKNTIKIHHTFAKRSASYTKRECVFHLRLADQSEFLIQANNESDMNTWIDTINFASACLSSPALPSAITNTKRQQLHSQRPILPVSYTKLSYWEQLIDHEERLQRLKVALDEHLSKAPITKRATKRYQTEFIEKIAHLKQDIERYTVYVDLMRKKSNSPEAIILSKHPQIASLQPSQEMVLSLPSFASPSSIPAASNSQLISNMEA